MATTETRRAIDLKLYIGGEWTEGTGDGVIEIRSPATGEHIANLPKPSKDDVRRAAETAREAQRRPLAACRDLPSDRQRDREPRRRARKNANARAGQAPSRVRRRHQGG